LKNIFNIEKEAKGWYCSRNDGRLDVHLAVNFYSKKEIAGLMPWTSAQKEFLKA
jgi:hypothetical protein